MTVCVKICGLTRLEDVRCAVAAGADYVGFVLYERSPRYVPLEVLRRLAAAVPPTVRRVGVVVNADPAQLAQAVTAGRLDVIQFHGDETADVLRSFRLATVWQAVALRAAADVAAAADSPAEVLVADAAGHTARGGTGQVCDWTLAAQLAGRRRMLLAGGLRPETVAEAVERVRPYGVDVSSGVESSPGVKDHDRVRRFIAAAKEAAARRLP